MRDFIWTLIIIWTIYQLSSLFRNRKKTSSSGSSPTRQQTVHTEEDKVTNTKRKAGDLEGDYVDFEEIK
jgi:hypothetical protein